MSLIGYARVSTTDQSLDIQLEQLRAAGCEKVFSERMSGTSTVDREALAQMIEWVRPGDVVMVVRLDRLARSLLDFQLIYQQLAKKEVGFRCLLQPIDTSTSEGRLMMNMLGAFAEFETEIRQARQAEGIERARARGAYRKRQKVTSEQVQLLQDQGLTAIEAAERLNVSRMTIYRKVPDGWGVQAET